VLTIGLHLNQLLMEFPVILHHMLGYNLIQAQDLMRLEKLIQILQLGQLDPFKILI